MGNWFVFFVESGREYTACTFLNKLFNVDESVAFVPQVELVFRNSKFVKKELKPMFPGYIFVDTELEGVFFASYTYKLIKYSKCILKLIGKSDFEIVPIKEEEKSFLLKFCDDDYIVGESIGIIEGDRIYINSGPLKGIESVIKKIDRHKRRAQIEMEFMGDVRKVHVALEIISKI